MSKILLVDDDEDFLSLLGEYLSLHDQQPDTAGSCGKAKSLLKDTCYDVIISDFNMPVENGLDLLRHVSEKYPEIPFIMMTGCDDKLVRQEAQKLGVAAFIAKPFFLDDLMKIIGDVLQPAGQSPEQIIQNFMDTYGDTPVVEHQW